MKVFFFFLFTVAITVSSLAQLTITADSTAEFDDVYGFGMQYGLNDKNGNVIVPAEYTSVTETPEGLYVYSKVTEEYITYEEAPDDGYWDDPFIDGDNEWLTYEEPTLIKRYGVVNKKGTTLPCVYANYYISSKAVILTDTVGNSYFYKHSLKKGNKLDFNVVQQLEDFVVVKNDKDMLGLYSEKLKEVLPITYSFIGTFDDWKYSNESDWEYDWGEGDEWGVYDDFPAENEVQNCALIIERNNKVGLFQSDKKRMIYEPQFETFDFTFSTEYIKVSKDGKQGFLNNKEAYEYALPLTYTSIAKFYPQPGDYYLVEKDGKKGLIKPSTLQVALPISYKKILGKESYVMAWPEEGEMQLFNRSDLSEYQLPGNYDDIRFYSKYAITKKDKKVGLLDGAFNEVLPAEYDEIKKTNYGEGLNFVVNKGNKKGIYSMESSGFVLPVVFEELGVIRDAAALAFITIQDGKYGLYHYQTLEQLLQNEYDFIDLTMSKDTIIIIKGGKKGYYSLKNKKATYLPQLADKFPLKWKQYIGFASYRTNITEENGKIYIGSNGQDRDAEEDKYDGVYILNSKTGEEISHFGNEDKGDNDVNGVGVYKNYVFFGNDNHKYFCFTTTGEKVWEYATRNDSEGCPALADLNGDDFKDVIFMTEDFGITALDGKTGKEIWKHVHTTSNYGRMLTSPALYDFNKDGVVDIIAAANGNLPGSPGRKYGSAIWVLNGKTGALIWQTLELGSSVFSSPIVTTIKGKTKVITSDVYGSILFINDTGRVENSAQMYTGIFSSPMISPKKDKLFSGSAWYYMVNGGVSVVDLANKKYIKEGGDADWEDRIPLQQIAGRVSASPVIADIDRDNKQEVIYVSEQGDLIIMDESGNVEQHLGLPSGAEATPLIKDIDGDGKLELLIAGTDGYIRCYSTNSRGKVFWGQFRGDNNNSGYVK